jgi:hypothetical protein
MPDLIIQEPLASRLREAAQREYLTPEAMLAVWMERYSPPPRPASSMTDDDIDVPEDVEDKAAYRAAARALAPKLYRMARRYWAQVGDEERLALTDEQLDKQFWLIDQDGVPRLKSEQGTIVLPPDPLDDLIGLFADSNVTDASTTSRETIDEYFQQEHDRTA